MSKGLHVTHSARWPRHVPRVLAVAGVTALAVAAAVPAGATGASAHGAHGWKPPPGISHVIVVDLENEDFGTSFGSASPARYLNDVLVPQGQLLTNYYAIGHASTDNYIAQVSGQAPNQISSSDCIVNTSDLRGAFVDVTPGTPDPDQATYPGQVDGNGCVYPRQVRTIGDQLDAVSGTRFRGGALTWRDYGEDMGNDPARDHGDPDPLGGTDCAHPAVGGGADTTNAAAPTDQYADRHVPFVFFHSVIDGPARCDSHVVPLGTVRVGTGGAPDTFTGHLASDLAHERTTPAFSFITPNLCNDGHDATCAGPNVEGTKNSAGKNVGGLVAADLWLKHWMPLILGSPAYRDGHTLVVVTFDESDVQHDATACCGERPGPNSNGNPGYSPLLGTLGLVTPPTRAGQYPGGGRIGAVLLNPAHIQPGSVNPTPYNHYSALRSYEDILGITSGGTDGHGHLGFAAQPGLAAFGPDVFNRRH
jgi:hypothetical protein